MSWTSACNLRARRDAGSKMHCRPNGIVQKLKPRLGGIHRMAEAGELLYNDSVHTLAMRMSKTLYLCIWLICFRTICFQYFPLHWNCARSIFLFFLQGRRKLEQEIEAEKQRIEDERRRKIEVWPTSSLLSKRITILSSAVSNITYQETCIVQPVDALYIYIYIYSGLSPLYIYTSYLVCNYARVQVWDQKLQWQNRLPWLLPGSWDGSSPWGGKTIGGGIRSCAKVQNRIQLSSSWYNSLNAFPPFLFRFWYLQRAAFCLHSTGPQ